MTVLEGPNQFGKGLPLLCQEVQEEEEEEEEPIYKEEATRELLCSV